MTVHAHAASPTAPAPAAASPAPRSSHRRGLAVAATVVVGAGLAWLTVTSAMAASGRRLADLEVERAVLLERRAAALTAHAAATDPRVLEAAARRLGFAPQADVERLGIALEPSTALAGAALDPQSPLAIMRGAAVGAGATGAAAVVAGGSSPAGASDMPALLLSVGAAESAHADELAGAGAAGR